MNFKSKIIVGTMIMILASSTLVLCLLTKVDPIILRQAQFTFELHSEIPTNVDNYIKANATVLEYAVVNLSNVVVDQVGTYDAHAEYGNKTYPFIIKIRDTKAPTASLVQTKYEIKVGDMLIAKDLVKDVSDDSDFTVYFDEEGSPERKIFDQAGTYNDIFVIVEDAYNNKSDRLRLSVVVSLDEDGPVISGVDDKTIQIGTDFDPLLNVRAYDDTDGDLTSAIIVTGNVDEDVAGEYTLTYRVTDLSGNESKAIRKITVQTDEIVEETAYQDIANGPFLTLEQYKQLESTYLTISRAMFTATNQIDLVTQISNYLIKFTEYAYYENFHRFTNSTYGAICNNIASNEGFSRTFHYICQKQGLESYYVEGTYLGRKMTWNIIKVGGSFYHIDLTYQKVYGEPFKLYSTTELKNMGYDFDESYYPVCNRTFS